jgi:hypothetical protein
MHIAFQAIQNNMQLHFKSCGIDRQAAVHQWKQIFVTDGVHIQQDYILNAYNRRLMGELCVKTVARQELYEQYYTYT